MTEYITKSFMNFGKQTYQHNFSVSFSQPKLVDPLRYDNRNVLNKGDDEVR